MMRSIVALVVTLPILSCSSAKTAPGPVDAVPIAGNVPTSVVPTEPPAEGSLTSKDSKQVARTLAKVSELRGIPATKPVPGVKLERDQLVARVKEKALREYPPEALKREGQLLQIMGFAPPTFDYLGEMLKLLEAQLEGFYEPKNGTMYLAADLRGTQAQATLAHELVHALQDQKWDLKPRSQYRPGRGDESMALACLAEGDATSLMLDFVMKPDKNALDIPDDALRELMKTGINMGDIQTVPHILRSTLVAPYLEGLTFVHALRRKGDWAAIDRVWARPPTTTEQILHADKWEANEAPIAIPAPTALALGEGWKRDDEDTYGELGFALAFAEWMEPEEARVAASGWGGDRTAVYSKADQIAFAIHLRYDAAPGAKPDTFADRAMGKIAPAMKKAHGKPAIADASTVCVERKETGPMIFARKERDVVVIAGPAKVAGGQWSSAGSCASAKKWADEVLAQR
ncbi:MAG: hypothetical protein KF819_03040 [Labilithrix sp.]|nr:hypothetical protein [Labilithrix sp.]